MRITRYPSATAAAIACHVGRLVPGDCPRAGLRLLFDLDATVLARGEPVDDVRFVGAVEGVPAAGDLDLEIGSGDG